MELACTAAEGYLERPRNPVPSFIGYLLWGALAGGLSLLILPTSPIANPLLRQGNVLLATPTPTAR